jgi:TRAP transporter TAXI family solute receptor
LAQFARTLVSILAVLILAACGTAATATVPAPAATTAASTAPSTAPTAAAGGASAAPSATRAATTAATTGTAAAPAGTAARASATASGAKTTLPRPAAGQCTSAAATKPRPSGKQRLVITTGGTGGVFFPYGGGLARILTAKLPNTEATAEVTGGSVDNMKLIQKGDSDLGLTTADSADEAQKGIGVYKDTGAVPVCTIAVLYESFIHVVALSDSGINTIADMKGKRISVGSAGSSTEAAADRILEAAGLNPKTDIQRDSLGVAESAGAMKDKKIAAFFWIGGLPTSAVTELATTGPALKFISTAEYVQPLATKYGPVYYPLTLPKSVYQKMPEDVSGLGVDNLLTVNANMSEQQVYDILKTLFDNQADVQAIHPEAKKFTLENAARVAPVPFHPGAIKYYTEKGVYKP